MQDKIKDIKPAYPLPVYNYKVLIDGQAVAFSEVAGLSISYETVTYKESPTGSGVGPRVLHMPSQANPVNITLKKGIVRKVSMPALYSWLKTTSINLVTKKDITVFLMDETGAAVISWKVINAFPTKLDAPSFDANSNEVAIESMELRADSILIEETA
ncbi:MAG: phage tail protein [Nannocystaceae bacterium]|nr:phage tail protein [Myxococcales bacterium]